MSALIPVCTAEDILLLNQSSRKMYVKLQLLNDHLKPVHELSGDIISGSFHTELNSLIRRTCDLTLHITGKNRYLLKEKSLWYTSYIRIFLGFFSQKTGTILYYGQGIYLFDAVNTVIDAANYTMSVSCIDMMGILDAAHKGQLTGNRKITLEEGHNIRETLIAFLKDYTPFKNYYIEEIGTYYDTEKDNTIPYDIELDGSSSILDVITALTGLYSFYETYIDLDGTFICKRMVTKTEEPVFLTSEYFTPFLISERTSYPLSEVSNIIELWGRNVSYDRFAMDPAVLSGSEYRAAYDNLNALERNICFAFKTSAKNPANPRLKINSFPSCPILHPDGTPVEAGHMEADKIYVCKYGPEKFYLQGQFDVHAVVLLCSKEPDNTEKEKFYKEFDCRNIYFDVDPDSPFTIERIGPKPVVLQNDEYANISTDYLGLVRAKYELYKRGKLTDTLSLDMACIPFLTVGTKVEYQPLSADTPGQYLVTAIETDLSDGTASTMTVSLTPFYNLYTNCE